MANEREERLGHAGRSRHGVLSYLSRPVRRSHDEDDLYEMPRDSLRGTNASTHEIEPHPLPHLTAHLQHDRLRQERDSCKSQNGGSVGGGSKGDRGESRSRPIDRRAKRGGPSQDGGSGQKGGETAEVRVRVRFSRHHSGHQEECGHFLMTLAGSFQDNPSNRMHTAIRILYPHSP